MPILPDAPISDSPATQLEWNIGPRTSTFCKQEQRTNFKERTKRQCAIAPPDRLFHFEPTERKAYRYSGQLKVSTTDIAAYKR